MSQVLSKNRVERLSVSTGCGIKPHQRLKLFNERRDVRPSAWPLEGVDEGAAVPLPPLPLPRRPLAASRLAEFISNPIFLLGMFGGQP